MAVVAAEERKPLELDGVVGVGGVTTEAELLNPLPGVVTVALLNPPPVEGAVTDELLNPELIDEEEDLNPPPEKDDRDPEDEENPAWRVAVTNNNAIRVEIYFMIELSVFFFTQSLY